LIVDVEIQVLDVVLDTHGNGLLTGLVALAELVSRLDILGSLLCHVRLLVQSASSHRCQRPCALGRQRNAAVRCKSACWQRPANVALS
jgi:hypothetical protein